MIEILASIYGLVLKVLLIIIASAIAWETTKLIRVAEKVCNEVYSNKKLQNAVTLMPYINAQAEKSAEFVINKNMSLVDRGLIKKVLSPQEYVKLIADTKTHFYGTIPHGISRDMNNYVAPKQIDVLILNAFQKINSGFFVPGEAK